MLPGSRVDRSFSAPAPIGSPGGTPVTRNLLEPSTSINIEENAALNVGEITKVGTYLGVFQPCLLNIFGSILFLRLGWSVGEAGVWGTLLVFFAAGMLVLLTALSVAAISTNGTMGGGGAYFMISRSLGPELGTAVGLLFYLGSSSSVAFYLVSFTLCINQSFLCPTDSVGANKTLFEWENCDEWVQSQHPEYMWGISSGVLILLLAQAEIGAGFVLKLNTYIFVVLMLSILLGWASLLASYNIANLSAESLRVNLPWSYTNDNDWLRVFIVVFPSVTGIMAGANYSGNLINPGKSIGSGTIAAIFFSVAVYAVLSVTIGAAFDRSTLQSNYFVLQDAAFHPSIIIAGIVCSTLSSALGQLDGSARVLQTLARDDILGRYVAKLGYGAPGTDDPRVALLLSWAVAQCCLFIPTLDDVAALVSGFYLLVYLFLNLSCFLLKISGVPNFRPRHRGFSWHTALAGAILALVASFAADWVKASFGIVIMISLVIYVHVAAPAVPWGDISQALIFHQVRKYLLQLDERKAHPKFWRPSLLLAIDDVRATLPLIQFCDKLKKGGLFIVASVIVTRSESQTRGVASRLGELRALWLELIDRLHVKAFCDVMVVSESRRAGAQALLGCAGLGGMKPNTVVIPYPEVPPTSFSFQGNADGSTHGRGGDVRLAVYNHSFGQTQICSSTLRQLENVMRDAGLPMSELVDAHNREASENFVQMVRDGLNFERNVLVARHFESFDELLITSFGKQAKEMKNRGIKLKAPWYDVSNMSSQFLSEESLDQGLGAPSSPGTSANYTRTPTRTKSREELLTKMSIDLWTVNATDWKNLAGTLALQLQLSYSLSRVGVFAKSAYIRVVAPVLDPIGERIDVVARKVELEQQLEQLLTELRVEAEVVVLTSVTSLYKQTMQETQSPPPGKTTVTGCDGSSKGAIYARKSDPQSQHQQQHMQYIYQNSAFGCMNDLSKIEALNRLIKIHSSRTCVAFLPLPCTIARNGLGYMNKNGAQFVEEIGVLSEGLPPCMLVAPGEHTPIVSTSI